MTDDRTPLTQPDFHHAPATSTRHRALSEPVLRSAEDELDIQMHDTGASYTGVEGSRLGYRGASQPPWWTQIQSQAGRYASEQPAKAALLALGAGALAALLLGRRFGGRRHRN